MPKPVTYAPEGVGNLRGDETFPHAAQSALEECAAAPQRRHATATIRDEAGCGCWGSRRLGAAARRRRCHQGRRHGSTAGAPRAARSGTSLREVASCTGRATPPRPTAIVVDLVRATGADEVVKVKSMATQEIGLNEALEAAGIAPIETDLAELIVQLGPRQAEPHPGAGDPPQPRRDPRDLRARDARRRLPTSPTTRAGWRWPPARICARSSCRRGSAISGANFAIAETGTLAVVESEGNGRMCLTLPDTLITVMGIEKVLPTWRDLEVFLQLLPRSSTGERMNPYTSMWTAVTPGDGPQEFHLVLLDNGRTAALADEIGRPPCTASGAVPA